MCRIYSADCFISGFTASQSPRTSLAKYSGLHLLNKWNTLYTKTRAPEKNLRSKDFLGKGVTAQKPAPLKGGADKRASCDTVGYDLLNSLSFAPFFSSKFSPATAGNIDCNLSLFHLPKDDKKAADIFFITDLKHKY